MPSVASASCNCCCCSLPRKEEVRERGLIKHINLQRVARDRLRATLFSIWISELSQTEGGIYMCDVFNFSSPLKVSRGIGYRLILSLLSVWEPLPPPDADVI